MQGNSFQEAVQGVSSSVGEVRAKTVAADVFHFVLVWERRNGALRVFSAERLVKKDEVGETPTDFDCRFLKGGEIGLQWRC